MNSLLIGQIVLAAITIGSMALIYHYANSLKMSARRISKAAARTEQSVSAATEALQANTAALNELHGAIAPLVKEASANLAAIPKLLEGISRIATAQMETTQAQREHLQALIRDPYGKPAGQPPPRDPVAADQEFLVQQRMRSEGVSREEALFGMNGANTQSVWDGGQMFNGWR